MPNAEGCIATQALARSVEERLGRTVFVSAAQADVSVEGRIEKRKAGGWHAVIILRDAKGAMLGTREIDRPEASCEAMNEPLALIIAVMIDPHAAMRPQTEAGAPEAEAPEVAPLPILTATSPDAGPPPPPPDAGPPKKDTWHFEGGGDVTIASGFTPTLAFGVGVEALLYPPGVPLGFRGYSSLFLPTSTEKDGAKASFDMIYVGGGLCPTIRWRVNIMACIGGQLGILRPRPDTPGRGIKDDVLPLWNAVAELRASLPLVAPVGMSGGVGAALPLLRPNFEYTTPGQGTESLHKVAPVAFTAELGLGFFFP